MYHNFIFDLYGTLVDIHTNENKTSLWKRLALFYSFQGASYTGRELRNRYRQLETAARKVPSSYTCPEICAADIFRTLYVEKGIQPTEALLTATGQFFQQYAAIPPRSAHCSSSMQKAVGSTSCPMPSGSSPNTSCARWDSWICSTVSLSPLTRGAASRIPLFFRSCLTATD